MHMPRFIFKWFQELLGSLLFTSIGFDYIGEFMHFCSKDKSVHVHISILFNMHTYPNIFPPCSAYFITNNHNYPTSDRWGIPPRWAGRISNVDSHHAAANDDSEPINMRHCKQYLQGTKRCKPSLGSAGAFPVSLDHLGFETKLMNKIIGLM